MFIKVLRRIFLVSLVVFACLSLFNFSQKKSQKLKLYWFIPDGLRNDPTVFDVYKWANEGKLPNIKKMMDQGSYGYSIPDFPSHTPTNFATLLTGSHPNVHGISDGAIHIEGYPLTIIPIGGFKSNAKNVPPAWVLFENSGLKTFLLSIPGSTPPETSKGQTVRGRWGGWGADFYAINFQDAKSPTFEGFASKSNRLFNNGPELTEMINSEDAKNIPQTIKSFSPVKLVKLNAWDGEIEGYIYDSSDDQKVNYDEIAFVTDKKNVAVNLKQGNWSDWLPITLKWRTRDDFNLYTPQKSDFEKKYATVDVPTSFRVKVIKLDNDGTFRVRFLFNILNPTLTAPDTVSDDLLKNVGPMVDFVDNYPPQLVYFEEDKQTFMEEANMSLDWHKKAVSHIVKTYSPDVVIQDTYTPNQMLTSRWWMNYVDPKSENYNKISDQEREKLWNEVKDMYKKIDDVLGEIIKSADKDTTVVFSSDHGAAVINKEVYLNNLFAKEGMLTVKYDEQRKIYDIDWEKSKVVFLENTNIYINPKGLNGNWKRASGPEYEALREKVINLISNLKDENGKTPLAKVVKWEDAEKEFNLPTKQAGDLVIANNVGYGWTEEVTRDQVLFKAPLRSGYKQGILASQEQAVWESFMIMGPGIKKGNKLDQPISNADQLPTILKQLHLNIPSYMQGKIVEKIFNNN